MGALHSGHGTLVREAAAVAKERGSSVIVSIFVNPTQFNDLADFSRYPKTFNYDTELCQSAGADCVYAPRLEDVYPNDPDPQHIALPLQATQPKLEDSMRPGHFAGVCQVVARLFRLVKPAAALFGEKDWQQLQVIQAMTASLALPIEILPVATVREPDGLAMSSRNRFLSSDDHRRGLALSLALCECQRGRSPAEAEDIMLQVLRAEAIDPDYAVVRDAQTLLAPLSPGPYRAIIAAKVGNVRLLDNAAWAPGK